MKWLEKHLEDQEKRMVLSDMVRVDDRQRANEQLTIARKELDEKLNKEVEVRTDSLKKDREHLKATEAKLARTAAKSKTYQDLCNAVADLANRIDKAERGRLNLTDHKNTPQSAFNKWEQQFCQPIKKLVDLIQETEAERREHDREFSEQSAAAQAQQVQAAELLSQIQQEHALLAEEKEHFPAEKQEWRSMKGRELTATEMKDTTEVFLQERIEQIKPQMLEEARLSNWMLQKEYSKAREAVAITDAKAQGQSAGYRTGYREGHAQGKSEQEEEQSSSFELRLAEAKRDACVEGYEAGHEAGMVESHDEAYEKGRNAGHSQGHQKGHAKGYAEGRAEGLQLGGEAETCYQEGYDEGYNEGEEAGKIE